MSNKQLYLIDATAFCYRAFYALESLSTSFGQPTNAVYGFVNILNKILKENNPQYIGACFDVSRETFRAKKFAAYKIQRPAMPDGLSGQIPLIKELIAAYGIRIVEKEGYEADDIIATLAKKAKNEGFGVTIIASDKDMLQLVDTDTVVFSPYKDGGITYDTKAVQARFGVAPDKIPDIIALMGDAVDNIPGVPGIGEKTATSLLKESGNLENLLSGIGQVKQQKLRQALLENIPKIKLNKELALLDANADITIGPGDLKREEPDYKELFRLFKRLEFKKMLKGLPISEETQDAGVLSAQAASLDEFPKQPQELVIYGRPMDELIFCADGKIFSGKLTSMVKGILADPTVKKIGHDLKKIKVALAKEGINLEGLYFDVMIAGYLVNPSKSGYGLADLALEYLSRVYKPDSLDAAKAIDLILQLQGKFQQMLSEMSLTGLFQDIEMPLAGILAEMELNGIKVDTLLLEGLSKSLEIRLLELVIRIHALSGAQFNINSPKQLREILFEKLKLPVIKRSKTGPSTDEEVLRRLAKNYELPQALLEYRQLTKLKTTYVDTLPVLIDSQTGRIHANFNQAVTETGRLSSSNPNLQNLPVKTEIGSKIRQAVIAGVAGSWLLSCDYSQVELRILAHLSGDENLINAFKNKEDIHRATAALIFTVEEDKVTQQMRETAKRVNFGIIYGLSAYGLSRDLEIPVDEAGMFIDAYFVKYPRVKEYIETQMRKAEEDGFVTTILGRRRYIPEIKNKNQAIRQFAQRQAVNTPIQGSASDLIKLAMIEIYRQIKRENLELKMLIQVHDELVFAVPEGQLRASCLMIKDKMENVLKLSVPVEVSIKKGKNWLQMEECL